MESVAIAMPKERPTKHGLIGSPLRIKARDHGAVPHQAFFAENMVINYISPLGVVYFSLDLQSVPRKSVDQFRALSAYLQWIRDRPPQRTANAPKSDESKLRHLRTEVSALRIQVEKMEEERSERRRNDAILQEQCVAMQGILDEIKAQKAKVA